VSSGEPDVELRAVTKRYGAAVAVRSLDLSIAKGEFVTLLGPSGCGKTTTLRMIGGFEEPTSGEVFVTGRPVSRTPKRDRQTRMVFQSYALFPHMTVVQNVAYGLRMQGVAQPEIVRRVGAALEMTGIAAKASAFPRDLSGGQQQRTALARALVTRPTVLLLDEPLGALDLKMRRRLQAELKTLQRELGITFVYVTHDQEEALALSDRIVVMHNGEIEQQGTPAAIYCHPASAFVADFVGETNLFRRAGSRDLIAIRPERVAL
jgi:spermidine/putrescine transport system ATP-binding protein